MYNILIYLDAYPFNNDNNLTYILGQLAINSTYKQWILDIYNTYVIVKNWLGPTR